MNIAAFAYPSVVHYNSLSYTLSEFDTFSFANIQEEIAVYCVGYVTQVFFRTYNKLDLIDSDYKILQFDIAKSLLLVYFAKTFGMMLFGMSLYRCSFLIVLMQIFGFNLLFLD